MELEEQCGFASGRPLCDSPASLGSWGEEDLQAEFYLETRSQQAITASQEHSFCHR